MNTLRLAGVVAVKDLRVEVRSRQAIGLVLPFVGTLLIAFGLALGPGRELLQQTAPGLLWLAVFFAAVLLFRRAYESEGEDGALEGLLLAPIDKAAVFLGKALAVTVQLLVLEVGVLAMVAVLFGMPLGGPGALASLAAACVLGSAGLAVVGTLFGVLTVVPRAREAVLPLLVMPLVTPVLVAATKATTLATVGRGGEVGSWLALLVAFDVAMLAASSLLFDHLLED